MLVPDLLPSILFGPLLGALVDRVGWRTCAIAADLLSLSADGVADLSRAAVRASFAPEDVKARILKEIDDYVG